MLRTEATEAGIPTFTVEMGEAHRFERPLIDHALAGIRSVFAEYNVYPGNPLCHFVKVDDDLERIIESSNRDSQGLPGD